MVQAVELYETVYQKPWEKALRQLFFRAAKKPRGREDRFWTASCRPENDEHKHDRETIEEMRSDTEARQSRMIMHKYARYSLG